MIRKDAMLSTRVLNVASTNILIKGIRYIACFDTHDAFRMVYHDLGKDPDPAPSSWRLSHVHIVITLVCVTQSKMDDHMIGSPH